MAIDCHASFRRIDDAANDTNQCSLAGTVWPEQRNDFAFADLEVNILQRLESSSVGFRQVFNLDNGIHDWVLLNLAIAQ